MLQQIFTQVHNLFFVEIFQHFMYRANRFFKVVYILKPFCFILMTKLHNFISAH